MTVRLSHRQKPDTQNYIFQALGSPFSLTGIAASLRIAYRMSIPDKIPYVLSGQPATVSKLPPVWGSLSPYSILPTTPVAATSLPVTVPGGGSPTITVAWHSSSVPSTKPSWVTLTSGTAPTIAFTGDANQIDSADVSSMVLSATANGTVQLSASTSITITSSSTNPTFTANIGQDIAVQQSTTNPSPPVEPAWDKAMLAPDGMFIWWCTGDHGQDQDNAVHGFNPWPISKPDATGTSRSAFTGWLRRPMAIGSYTDQYDNMAHWMLSSSDPNVPAILVTPSRAAFRPDTATWAAGNLPPSTQTWKAYIKQMTANDEAANYWNTGSLTNPICQWVEAENCLFVAGGAASQSPVSLMWKIERTVPADGLSEPWKITRYPVPSAITTLGISIEMQSWRNLSAAVGSFVYFCCENHKFWKIDVRDMTSVTSLSDWPTVSNEYYPLMTYDERRQKILLIGQQVHSYDIASNVWSNITPSGWIASYWVMGDYHRELDAHYFRRWYSGDSVTDKRSWHKLYLGNPTNNPRWRSQTVGASPFKGMIENGYGQNKHVSLAWHPTKKRLYNCGGDFGYTSSGSPFFQPEPNQTVATNQPSGARSYSISDSLRTDMYSFDPLASGTQDWRLEHPLYQRNISGSPEQKPGFTDQVGWVWDDRPAAAPYYGQKFWCFQHHIRDDQAGTAIGTRRVLADGVTPDPWANGDTFLNSYNQFEGLGTYSWTPGTSGSPGTWVKETNNYMWGDTAYSTPTQVGNALRIYSGSPDHYYCGTWAQYKPASDGRFISLFGDAYSTNLFWMTTFDPAAKTYAWRKLSFPASTLCWSWIGPMVIIDDYAYTTALTRQSGVRKSQLLKIHIPTALSYAAGSTLPSSLPQFVDCPFSFEPDGLWESAGTGGNLFHEVGLVGIDRKIVLIGSYGATLVKPSGTRLATYVHDTGRWLTCDSFPGVQYNSKCWVAIPESGEVLMMPNSSSDDTLQPYSPHNTYWYYRVR